jgi:putative ABC transport system permease protein
MLGVFIGIAAVISLISLGQGLQTAINSQFSSLGTDKLIIQNTQTSFGVPGSTGITKLTSHDVSIIERVNGIKEVIPRLIRPVKLEFNKALQFGYLADIPNNKKQVDLIYQTLNVKIQEGKLLSAGERGKVVLGNSYTDENLFEKEIKVGDNIKIQGRDFQVAGILKKASSFQVNYVILMNVDDMKDLLNIEDEVDMITVQVADEKQIEQVASNIEKEMRRDRKEKVGEESFSVQTPTSALGAANTILNVVNIILIGIASISLLIGAVGITNTMYTSVLERTKEIGIMKAVGAKNSDILKVFIIESGLLGLVGGIIGVILGLSLAFSASFAANSYFGENLFTIALNYPLIIGAIVFSFLLGTLAGVLPAIQASKLNVVDAVRR